MKTCPNCGVKITPGDVFCSNCGVKLSSSSRIQAEHMSRIKQASRPPQSVKPASSSVQKLALGLKDKQPNQKSGNWFKRHKAIMIVAVMVIIALLGFAGIKCHQENSGVLANANLTYYGSNGKGRVHISEKSVVNIWKQIFVAKAKKSGLSNKLTKKLENAESYTDWNRAIQAIEEDHSQGAVNFEKGAWKGNESLTIEITPNRHLKNGDKVTLKVKQSDVVKQVKKRYDLDLSPKTYKVSGLR